MDAKIWIIDVAEIADEFAKRMEAPILNFTPREDLRRDFQSSCVVAPPDSFPGARRVIRDDVDNQRVSVGHYVIDVYKRQVRNDS